jgi:diacylglycerol O-acyltransferase-1
MKNLEDIGRPLTNNPHLSHVISPLEMENVSKQNYRGFLNLLILVLVVANIRLMFENYMKYGLLIYPLDIIRYFIEKNNLIYLIANTLLISASVILCFLIEKALAKSRNNYFLRAMHAGNLFFLLFFPIYMHKFKIVNAGKFFKSYLI